MISYLILTIIRFHYSYRFLDDDKNLIKSNRKYLYKYIKKKNIIWETNNSKNYQLELQMIKTELYGETIKSLATTNKLYSAIYDTDFQLSISWTMLKLRTAIILYANDFNLKFNWSFQVIFLVLIF